MDSLITGGGQGNTYADRLLNLARQISATLTQFCRTKSDGTVALIDPFERRVIGNHYALTHFGAALILSGLGQHDDGLVETGQGILRYFLANQASYVKMIDYHHDFNHFALAFVSEKLEQSHGKDFSDLRRGINQVLLTTPDSHCQMVNWLPMRIYANRARFHLTGEARYLRTARKLAARVRASAHRDGFFDDRLPRGGSFNPQYHTYTTAVTSLLPDLFQDFDLEPAKRAVLACIDPEGDFNYFGRGCNQIFGWGPYLYLLYTMGRAAELEKALRYLEERLPAALQNGNILLNGLPGAEKLGWWDYHYSSVYYSHLLFWLTIIIYCFGFGQSSVTGAVGLPVAGDSGLRTYGNEECFCAVFDGRKHFLAERGPMVCNLWLRGYGSLFKGPFGPYHRSGSKYLLPVNTLLNFCGPVKAETSSRFFKRGVLFYQAFLEQISDPGALRLSPIFPRSLAVAQDGGHLTKKTYQTGGRADYFHLPVFKAAVTAGCMERIVVKAGDQAVELMRYGELETLYGNMVLFQTRPRETGSYTLEIICGGSSGQSSEASNCTSFS